MNTKENLLRNPIIAAAQHENLKLAVESKVSSIILINGRLNDLMEEEFQICNKKKNILLHTDLIKGLSNERESIDFIKNHINTPGIVSTKSTMIRAAKKKGLITIQRIFLIDSSSLRNSIVSIKENDPDIVEVMPALVYPILEELKNQINKPIILGGLVNNSNRISEILSYGVEGVSCSNSDLWNLDI